MPRQMVGKFAQNEVKPYRSSMTRKQNQGVLPLGVAQKSIQARAEDPSPIPHEYGGGGVKDMLSQVIVMEELGAGDNGFASCIRSAVGLASLMEVLWNKEQKDEFFGKIKIELARQSRNDWGLS